MRTNLQKNTKISEWTDVCCIVGNASAIFDMEGWCADQKKDIAGSAKSVLILCNFTLWVQQFYKSIL